MRLALCLSILAGLAAPASAQSLRADADPVAETVRARSGRAPAAADVSPRGTAPHPDADCAGLLDATAPDAVVNWDGGALQFWVRADFDATMTVVGPDGALRCDDDSEGRLPVVAYGAAPRGRYAVWVGAFSPDATGQAATLYAGTPPATPRLDVEGRPTDGTLRLRAGFSQQADETREVDAAGADALAGVQAADGQDCAGFVRADRPSARLRYEGGDRPLFIRASSPDQTDLVLAAVTPDGIVCNDDWDVEQGTDPGLAFEAAPSGDYAVWVGTFGSHARADAPRATLHIGEVIPEVTVVEDIAFDDDLFDEDSAMGGTPYSTGTFTPFDPDARPDRTADYDGEPLALSGLMASGDVPNPVEGMACSGALPAAPTVAISLGADGPLALRAAADTDLVLTARLPDGTWMCSDDADGTNPGIQLDGDLQGMLTVWVGTFSPGDESEASLTLAPGTVDAPPPPPAPPAPNDDLSATPFSPGTYGGSGLEPGAPLQTLALSGARARANVRIAGDVPNPVQGDACVGFVTAQPAAAVTVAQGGPLALRAFSATDAVMVVQTPAGDWFCSDDARQTEPEVRFEDGGAGTYSVWLGTFSQGGDPVQMTLLASRPADG